MKIAVGSDMDMHVARVVVENLRERGHEVRLFGALDTCQTEPWPAVGVAVARAVARGESDQGILFCWTGTGVSIAANKVKGIRAALCPDAATAAGARQWNDANILVMSLRLTSEVVAKEILDAWFKEGPSNDESDLRCFRLLNEIESERAD